MCDRKRGKLEVFSRNHMFYIIPFVSQPTLDEKRNGKCNEGKQITLMIIPFFPQKKKKIPRDINTDFKPFIPSLVMILL